MEMAMAVVVLAAVAAAAVSATSVSPTEVTIETGPHGPVFQINGQRTAPGSPAEGLLLNARLIQAVFDDDNENTVGNWKYPDTQKWDPDRNTDEFIGNLTAYRERGLLAFTVGLQGGSPHCYGNPTDGPQKWNVSAFNPDGSLKPKWLARLGRLLAAADTAGMVPIVQYFYYAQFPQLSSQTAINRAVTDITRWLVNTGHKNFLVEVFNENCSPEIAELVDLVHNVSEAEGHRLLAGSSCGGSTKGIPSGAMVSSADFVLVHGNGAKSPMDVTAKVASVRAMPEFVAHPKPILYNEDDHGCLNGPQGPNSSDLGAAVASGASWGFLCCCDGAVQGDYWTGYQCPPVNWGLKGKCLSGPKGIPMPNGSKDDFFTAIAHLSAPH